MNASQVFSPVTEAEIADRLKSLETRQLPSMAQWKYKNPKFSVLHDGSRQRWAVGVQWEQDGRSGERSLTMIDIPYLLNPGVLERIFNDLSMYLYDTYSSPGNDNVRRRQFRYRGTVTFPGSGPDAILPNWEEWAEDFPEHPSGDKN